MCCSSDLSPDRFSAAPVSMNNPERGFPLKLQTSPFHVGATNLVSEAARSKKGSRTSAPVRAFSAHSPGALSSAKSAVTFSAWGSGPIRSGKPSQLVKSCSS